MNKVTRTVSAREANQQFSQLLAAVERGEEVTITKHGTPVAIMRPAVVEPAATSEAERQAALARIRALMREGIPIGGPFTRDEMHER